MVLVCALWEICVAQNASEDYGRLSKMSSETLMKEGREYFEHREAGNALSRFMIVADRYGKSDDVTQKEASIRALNNIACVYKYLYYDYPRAYEYFNRALTECEETGYDSFLPVILVNMGDLLYDYGTTYNSPSILSEAEDIFEDCFDIAMESHNWELLTTAFYNLSNLNYEINLSEFDEIFSKEIPSDTPDIEYVRLQYRGIEKIQRKEYAEARKYFERQLGAISTPWEANRDTISTYLNIAETYMLEKRPEEAAAPLEAALRIAESSHTIDMAAFLSLQLERCYKESGDTSRANLYRSLYLEKMEDLHNAQLSNIGEMKYISQLRKEETNAREIAYKNRSLRAMLIAMGIVLITIALATILILRKNRQLSNRNRTLFEKYGLLLEAETRQKEAKYTRSNLDDTRKENLIGSIREVMEDSEEICHESFSLKDLARIVDSNTTYVSQVINEKYGITFSTLLGNARVRLVCKRISEGTDYSHLTIEGVANSVGFKSRTAFINAFKREVGLTPSQYIKMAMTEKKTSDTEKSTDDF